MTFGARALFATSIALALMPGEGRAQTFTKMPLDMPAEAVPAPPQEALPQAPAPQPRTEAPLQGEADVAGPGSDCGALAGLYLAPGNLKIWVTRRGAMVQENPLRPLTNDQFVILQIVVNNRMASAYGPDFDNLRRAGPPQTLEASGGTKISWAQQLDPLPRSLRVVADDGAVVLGPIPFSACAEAPKVAAPPPAAKRPRKTPVPETGAGSRPSMALPQGAIP